MLPNLQSEISSNISCGGIHNFKLHATPGQDSSEHPLGTEQSMRIQDIRMEAIQLSIEVLDHDEVLDGLARRQRAYQETLTISSAADG